MPNKEFTLDMLEDAPAAPKKEFSLDMLEEPSAPQAGTELAVEPPSKNEAIAQELAGLPSAPKIPLLDTEKVTPAELAVIAKNRGVSVADLAPAVGWLGGYREQAELSDIGRTAVSKAAELVPLGGAALQRGYKELYGEGNPNLRAAFDDLQELIDKKKSGLEMAAEFGVGLATGSTETKLVGKLGQAIGGTAKAAEKAQKLYHGAQIASIPVDVAIRQREGEELFGLGVGSLVAGVVSLASKAAAKKVPEAMEEIEKAVGADIKTAIKKERELSQPIQDAVFAKVIENKNIPKELEKDMAAAARKSLGPEDIEYIERAGKSANISVDELLAHRYLEDEAVDFARNGIGLSASEAEKIKSFDAAKAAIADFLKKEGESLEYAKVRWEASRDSAAAKKLAQEGLLKIFGPDEAARMENQTLAIKDGKYALRTIDRQLGTNAEGAQQELSSAYNTINLLKLSAAKKINEINDLIGKSGASREQLMHAMETGDEQKLSPEGKAAVAGMRDYYKGWREFFEKELNFKIEALKGSAGGKLYVPHQMLPIAERVVAIKQKAMQAGEAAGLDLLKQMTPQQYSSFKKTPLGEELVRGLAAVTGSSPSSPEKFLASLHAAMDPIQNASRESTIAVRNLQREGNLPSFLREKDPIKLMYSWIDGTAKHVLSREPLAKIAAVRDQAIAVGNKRAADYLTTLMQDITGGRVDGRMSTKLNDFFVRSKIKALETASKYPEGSFKRMSMEALADAPQLFGMMQANLYPSYLGFSPRATLMNLLQVPTMTVPEVGPVYGSLTALRASIDFINNAQQIARGAKEIVVKSPALARKYGVEVGQTVKAKSMADLLNNEGLLSADVAKMRPALSALEKGFRSTALYKFTDAAQKQIAHKAMLLYQMSEFTNRALTVNMADRIAEDLMQSRQGAMTFLRNVSSGPKREIAQAIKSGNAEQVKELTRKYLLAKTIFNYDRATMSEFGRAVGPLLSIFTKWPTSIAGDVLASYEERGALGGSMQVARKYLAPYIAMAGIGSFLLPSPEDDGLTRMFVGRQGLGSAAPIGALGAFVSGDLISPPALQAAGELMKSGGRIAKTAMEEPESLPSQLPGAILRTGAKTLAPFTPGGVFIRMLDKDLPAYWGEDSYVEEAVSSFE